MGSAPARRGLLRVLLRLDSYGFIRLAEFCGLSADYEAIERGAMLWADYTCDAGGRNRI